MNEKDCEKIINYFANKELSFGLVVKVGDRYGKFVGKDVRFISIKFEDSYGSETIPFGTHFYKLGHPPMIGDCLAKMNEKLPEKWNPVIGYEELYHVSNYGRVASLIAKERKILKTSLQSGYPKLILCKNGEQKTRMIHKLMQEAFFMDEGEIDHIDCNPENNYIENLRVCTSQQNKVNSRGYGKSGVKGISKHKASGKWQAKIMREGKYRHLGLYDSKEEAAVAYASVAELLDGVFYRYPQTNEETLIRLWQPCGFTRSLNEIMSCGFEEADAKTVKDYKGKDIVIDEGLSEHNGPTERLKDKNAETYLNLYLKLTIRYLRRGCLD